MANVTVTTSTSNVNVNSTTNQVNVTSTLSNITLSTAAAVSNTIIRAAIGNTLPITYNTSTGIIGFDANLDDLTLKKYQETIVNNGNVSGNISVNITNGTIHQQTLAGNITGINLNNIATGGSATLYLNQSAVGGRVIDTTTTPSNWTNWLFANESTELDTNPNAWNFMSVIYDG